MGFRGFDSRIMLVGMELVVVRMELVVVGMELVVMLVGMELVVMFEGMEFPGPGDFQYIYIYI